MGATGLYDHGLTHDTFTVELVWDQDVEATALAGGAGCGSPTPIHVGAPAGWLPQHYLALALASSFMASVLSRADEAEVRILGYVAIAKLHSPTRAPALPHVVLNPCIVVATDEQRARLSGVIDDAVDSSDICRLLRGCLLVNADIRSLDDAADALPSW